MAYVLLSSQFLTGLQSNTALLLESLRQITLVSPFTIPACRTALELNQTTTFTNNAFDQFLHELYDLELDQASLTAAEKTVLNVIRDYLQPQPSFNCCGTDTPTLAAYTKEVNDKVGSATFEKEFRLKLADTVTCDVFNIEVTFNPVSPAPALTVSPVTLSSLGCVQGKSVYSKLWIDFVSTPAGQSYDLIVNFKDSTGASIVSIPDYITIT